MGKFTTKNLRFLFKNKLQKNDVFIEDYVTFITGREPSSECIEKIMRFIAFLLVAGDEHLIKLAYYLSIRLGIVTGDYTVLRDISNRLGYYPVVALIDRINSKSKNNLGVADALFSEALALTFKDKYYRTEEQYYFDSNVLNHYDVRAIAPTSYGKSQLMIRKCIERYNNGEKACIVIPTKALLSQTVSELMRHKGDRKDVITHPDMMTRKTVVHPHIAILTQERLMSIITSYPNITYDYLFIDEAHNLFSDDLRASLLARDIIILKARQPSAHVDYFSPFISLPDVSLNIMNISDDFVTDRIDEFVKVPQFFVWDETDGGISLYDQFIDDFFAIRKTKTNIYSAMLELGGAKNIIYVNKPSDVEQIADALADRTEEISFSENSGAMIKNACDAISTIINDSYNLKKLLRHGIAISHGRMMDIIRNYIEYLFKVVPELKYMVTTSTLLEGVNIPAERIFICDYRKGRKNLSYSSFHNLVGRICRFSDIFSADNTNIGLLIPKIYIMNNSLFMRSDAKPTKFLKSIARDDITQKEVISNPLMKEYKGDDKDEKRINETNILGNIDSGRKNLYNNIGNTQPTLAQTDFGKACFKNGVDFFDIFTFEVAIDYQLRDVSNIENVNELIDIISNCILTKTYNPHKKKWIYDVFINGVLKTKILRILMSRSSGEFNFANLVARDISLWKEKLRDEKFYIAYVGKIGDCDRRGGKDRFNNYHRFEKDKYNLMASYAVSLEKENLDNIDYNFMPIVDTLNDLNKVEKTFYKRLKYGTDDDFTIKLIQLGLDLSLAKIITDTPSFRDLFSEDGNDNLIYCTDKDSLVSRMLEKNMPVIYIKLVSDLL